VLVGRSHTVCGYGNGNCGPCSIRSNAAAVTPSLLSFGETVPPWCVRHSNSLKAQFAMCLLPGFTDINDGKGQLWPQTILFLICSLGVDTTVLADLGLTEVEIIEFRSTPGYD
jgi:hypothetical protein